jgi:50S ribosomal protein L16 3-hydroxylase
MNTTTKEPPVLAPLLAPLTEEQFLERHWPGKPFVHHGAPERLGFLPELSRVGDLAWLCKNWQGPIVAWPKPGSGAESRQTTAHEAEALYRAGWTLFFTHIERCIPAVRKVFNRFAAELGVDPADVNCEAFFSHVGAGTAPHFDGNWGFNVQLRGTKEWTVADNEHVVMPDIGHAMGAKPDAQLVRHAKLPFPRAMPPSSTTFTAREGSVVFVPSAWWHTTTVTEESAALVFTIQPRRWASLFAQEVEGRLRARTPVARSGPLLGSRSLRARHQAELAHTLGELRAVVQELEAEELLTAWSAQYESLYAVPPETRVEVSERPGPAWGLVVEQRAKRFETAIEKSAGDVLRWAAALGRGFAIAELCDAFPQRESTELLARVEDLQRARLITRYAALS